MRRISNLFLRLWVRMEVEQYYQSERMKKRRAERERIARLWK